MTDADQQFRVNEAGRAALQQVNEMIRFADVKAAAVLAAASVLASQLATARGLWASDNSWWSRSFVIGAAACAGLSVLLALYTLAPRRQEVAPESLHYYRHVARRFGTDREGFIDAWLTGAADDEATGRAVAGQIWAANLVADRKFARMMWSIRLLVIGVAALTAAVLT